MEERDKLLNALARVVGLFGTSDRASIEVPTDDDETRTYPVSEDQQVQIDFGRRVLHECGREPIPLMKMGS